MKNMEESVAPLKRMKHQAKKHKSHKGAVKVIPLEETPLEDLSLEGEPLEFMDPHFKSELDYDGYLNIEDYNNHAMNAEVDGKVNPEEELNFEEDEDKIPHDDEDFIDPRENNPLR